MQVQPITPQSLLAYNKYFTDNNPDFDIIDDFFFISDDLIYAQEKLLLNTDVDEIFETTNIKSEDELNIYLEKYKKFTFSISAFYDRLYAVDTSVEAVELCTELYYSFKEINNSDFEAFAQKLRKITINSFFYIFKKYNIIEDENIDVQIIEKIGEQKLMMLNSMKVILYQIETKPESINDSILKSLFSSLIILLLDMNIQEFKRAHLSGKHNRTGRNDPCPCGSGMKFKKCCL